MIPACASSSPAFHMMCVLPFIKIKFHLCSICVWGLKFCNVVVPYWLLSDLQGPCSCGLCHPSLCSGWVRLHGVLPTRALPGASSCSREPSCPLHIFASPHPALQPQLFPETIHPWLNDPCCPLVPSTNASSPPLYLCVSTASQLPFTCISAALHRLGPLPEDRSSAL